MHASISNRSFSRLPTRNARRRASDAELRTLREEIGILRSKAASAEERMFYTAATVKDVQQALKEEQENVSHVEEKLADTRSRLRDVEDGHRKIEDSMRSKTHQDARHYRTDQKPRGEAAAEP